MSATLITVFQNKKECIFPGKYPFLFSFITFKHNHTSVSFCLPLPQYHVPLHFFRASFVASEMEAQSNSLHGVQIFQFFFDINPVLT